MTDSVDQLPSDLALAVVRLARHLRGNRDDSTVSLTQMSALSALGAYGPLTPGQLAAKERVQPPSMTRVIASLSDLGYVVRTPHPSDGRQVIVSLSESGEKLVSGEAHAREAWLKSRLEELTPTERETLTEAVSYLSRLVAE